MTRELKVKIKKERAARRRILNKERSKKRRRNSGLDCPFDVEMNGIYGSCSCGGIDYESCCGDI